MKINLLLCCSFVLLASVVAHATPVLVTGTPADSLLSTPTSASPNLHGTTINFDSLTPFTTFSSSYTSGGVTISSPDGFVVYPFSTQSSPNELFDNSSNGSANITIKTGSTDAIGVGIADSDPVTIELQPLTAAGTDLGSPFGITISETTDNPGNGYFVVEDTSADIYGLQITESAGSASFSGLAIDDVQVATPEPGTVVLSLTGLALVLVTRKRAIQRFRPSAGTTANSGSGDSGFFPAA